MKVYILSLIEPDTQLIGVFSTKEKLNDTIRKLCAEMKFTLNENEDYEVAETELDENLYL